jgi:hypothetical protein
MAGNCWINAHNVFAQETPYRAWNLSGYGGGVLGPDTLEDRRSSASGEPVVRGSWIRSFREWSSNRKESKG